MIRRVAIDLFVALAVADFASAFVPTALVPKARHIHRCAGVGAFEYDANVGKGKLVVSFVPDPQPTPKPTPTPPPPEVFKGVHLPKNEVVPKRCDNEQVKTDVENFVKAALPVFTPLEGKPKSDGLQVVRKLLIDTTLKGSVGPDNNDYKFFGNDEHSKTLTYLLKTNPFFASALTDTEHGFELKSFDPEDPDNKDEPSLYRKILGTLSGPGHRVNFQFDGNMDITGFHVYDDFTGKRVLEDEHMQEDRASSVIFNVFFYSQCVHATIHVFHYLMTSAFQVASKDFDAMEKWATTYASNMVQKYQQVGTLLIVDPPPVPPAIAMIPEYTGDFIDGTYAILTGPMGFGSSQEVRPFMKDMLDMWGQSAAADGWLDCMMNIPAEKMESAGILTEFKRHYELVKPFAAEAANALREIDEDKYTIADLRLKGYLKSCGSFKSDIDGLQNWIELMGVTGVVHGGTLSMTRVFGNSDVLRWRNVNAKSWDMGDVNLMLGGLGTLIGMEEGRHVMSSTTEAPYAPTLQAVLDKYDTQASKMKKDYETAIMTDRDVFDNYGWILSDFCSDGFDGKQLTSTTYI
jgi:hypothetical protein